MANHAKQLYHCKGVPRGKCNSNMYSYDYSCKAETPDQLEIRKILESAVSSKDVVLHVGAGNSTIARHLSNKVQKLIGITVSEMELQFAKNLELHNYECRLLDKYSSKMIELENRGITKIVDNNVNSFACCYRHYLDLLNFYYSVLPEDGLLFSHAKGFAWSIPGSPKLSLDEVHRDCSERIGFDVEVSGGGALILKKAGKASKEN